MIEVVAAVTSKFDEGDYARLFHLHEEIWFCLNDFGANVLRSTRRDTGDETVDDPRAVPKKRLDVEMMTCTCCGDPPAVTRTVCKDSYLQIPSLPFSRMTCSRPSWRCEF